jgi:hypothetical protein
MFLTRDEHRFARLSLPCATLAYCEVQIMTAWSISDAFAWRARPNYRTYFLSNSGRYAS